MGLVLRSQLVSLLGSAGMAGELAKSRSWLTFADQNDTETDQGIPEHRAESASLSSLPNQVRPTHC